ncbi:MAG: Rne/Rng family ribonuclease [Actinomycetota bacterium]
MTDDTQVASDSSESTTTPAKDAGDSTTEPSSDPKGGSGSGTRSGARRRRGSRGGRGRSRSKATTDAGDEAKQAPEAAGPVSGDAAGPAAATSDAASEGRSGTRSGSGSGSRTGDRSRSSSGRRRPSSTKTGGGEGGSTDRAAADKGTNDDTPTEDGAGEAADPAGGSASTGQRRRRRRGGRGRSGSGGSAGSTSVRPDGDIDAAGVSTQRPDDDASSAETGERAPSSKSRSRRRRRKPAGAGTGAKPSSSDREDEPSLDDPPAAIAADEDKNVVRASSRSRKRPARKKADDKGAKEPSSRAKSTAKGGAKDAPASGSRDGRKRSSKKGIATVAGPTRMRRSRTTRTRAPRRRHTELIIPPRITDKQMVITEHGDRDQIAILEDRDLVQHYVTRAGAKSMVGNVYLGRVQNVLPGMEAAFIDVGRGRNAVLYAGEVNYSAEELDGDTPPRIEEVLKSGQSVIVQVTKDPMGGKGARLTAQISMPGRFLVMVPNSSVFGISRRIDDEDRKRLKAIAKKVKPSEHGLIIRTAAEKATEEQLADDLQRTLEAWKTIEKRSKKVKAPDLLYEEPELTVRVVRDLFTDEEYKELVTDAPAIYEKVNGYLTEVAPDLAEKVRMHEGKLSAFEEFHVTEQIHKALDRKVWLPSGGYLIIERTEAMTVIDVNTGKSVGKTNLEETVVNTNLEAAAETARQLRLRDIGGIIIVDFIDMLLEKNKNQVVDTLREAMALDKTRSQVYEIGPLGLLEITRKRVSGGLVESFSETCPTCEGRGILINYDVD